MNKVMVWVSLVEHGCDSNCELFLFALTQIKAGLIACKAPLYIQGTIRPP